MNVLLTIEDVYKIVFITMRGWNLYSDKWKKEGQVNIIRQHQICGCCVKDVETDDFTLDEAYNVECYI